MPKKINLKTPRNSMTAEQVNILAIIIEKAAQAAQYSEYQEKIDDLIEDANSQRDFMTALKLAVEALDLAA